MGKPTCDNLNSIAERRSRFLAYDFRLLGKVSHTEYIGVKRRTWGTEISKYPVERTSTETPLVVTSERGPGQ